MVARDLAARGVTDKRVLRAMATVPRERFVDPAFAEAAYEDRPLPLRYGQTISQPLIVAMMAEAAEIKPGDTVLEVGTGCGYAAAVLAELATEVHTVERLPELAAQARTRLQRLGIANVAVHDADGSLGWPDAAPYDAIVVSAGARSLPAALVEQVAFGGRLIIPLGEDPPNQQLLRLRRVGRGNWEREDLGAVRFVPLVPDSPG